MNSFILCIDNELKLKMIQSGFKVIKEESYGTIFAQNHNIKFNFEDLDKKKFMYINKMAF